MRVLLISAFLAGCSYAQFWNDIIDDVVDGSIGDLTEDLMEPCTEEGDECGGYNDCRIYDDGCRQFECARWGGDNIVIQALEKNPFWCIKPTCDLYPKRCVEKFDGRKPKNDDSWREMFPDWIVDIWDLEGIESIPEELQNFDPSELWEMPMDEITQPAADNYCDLINYEMGNERMSDMIVVDLCKRSPICEYDIRARTGDGETEFVEDVIGMFGGERIFRGKCQAIDMGNFSMVEMNMDEFVGYMVRNLKMGDDGMMYIDGWDAENVPTGDFNPVEWADMMSVVEELTHCGLIPDESICDAAWAYCMWKDGECMDQDFKEEQHEVTKQMDSLRGSLNNWNWFESFASCEVIPVKTLCLENGGWCRWRNGECSTKNDWRDELSCIEEGDGLLETLDKCLDEQLDDAAESCGLITVEWLCIIACKWDDYYDECVPNRDELAREEQMIANGESPLWNAGETFDCGSLDFYFCTAAFFSCRWNTADSTCRSMSRDQMANEDWCNCPRIYDPVCVSTTVTYTNWYGDKYEYPGEEDYGNKCLAECRGHFDYKPRSCRKQDNYTCMSGRTLKDSDKVIYEKTDACDSADGPCGIGTEWAWDAISQCSGHENCCVKGRCTHCVVSEARQRVYEFYYFEGYQRLCAEEEYREEECKNLGCGGKLNKLTGKCKAPKKAKQIKCKDIIDMTLCVKVRCTVKRNTCKGKSRLE